MSKNSCRMTFGMKFLRPAPVKVINVHHDVWCDKKRLNQNN